MAGRRRASPSLEENAAYWFHGGNATVSLGCQHCPELGVCGGLSVLADAYDCLSYCRCSRKEHCDNVCRKNQRHFVRRIREVHGFDLSNVPRVEPRGYPDLPSVVPIVYNGISRHGPLEADAVALPFFQLIERSTGKGKFADRQSLADAFRFLPSARIIATATAKDRPLEAWWKLKSRSIAIASLKRMGVDVVTSPNFSVFSDVPRWDNLYNVKRIALVWAELQAAGPLTALHINARTDTDYERWSSFVAERPEIAALAFEFGTGAGWPARIPWHVERLCQLAQVVRRPVTLFVRGGASYLRDLRGSFSRVVFLDTDAFIKTHHRQRASADEPGRLLWSKNHTPKGAPLDELLEHNFRVVAESLRPKREVAQHREALATSAGVLLRPEVTRH